MNLFISITIPSSVNFGTVAAGTSNSSASGNPYASTYTANAILLFQLSGSGDPANEFGDSFPLANLYVGKTTPASNNDGIKLSTSPQSLYTNLGVALNQNENSYWFVTTPNPFPPGTYTFAYIINIGFQNYAT